MAGGMAAGPTHEVNNVIWMCGMWLAVPSPQPTQVVSLTPDASQLPFTGTLHDLANGLMAVTLILVVAALVFGGASWALGNATGNMSWAERGKQTVVTAALAALLIGGAALIINFFFSIGSG